MVPMHTSKTFLTKEAQPCFAPKTDFLKKANSLEANGGIENTFSLQKNVRSWLPNGASPVYQRKVKMIERRFLMITGKIYFSVENHDKNFVEFSRFSFQIFLCGVFIELASDVAFMITIWWD